MGLVDAAVSPDVHGAKLVAQEAPALVTNAFLTEKHRPGRCELHHDGGKKGEQSEHRQRRQAAGDVNGPLPAWHLVRRSDGRLLI